MCQRGICIFTVTVVTIQRISEKINQMLNCVFVCFFHLGASVLAEETG